MVSSIEYQRIFFLYYLIHDITQDFLLNNLMKLNSNITYTLKYIKILRVVWKNNFNIKILWAFSYNVFKNKHYLHGSRSFNIVEWMWNHSKQPVQLSCCVRSVNEEVPDIKFAHKLWISCCLKKFPSPKLIIIWFEQKTKSQLKKLFLIVETICNRIKLSK